MAINFEAINIALEDATEIMEDVQKYSARLVEAEKELLNLFWDIGNDLGISELRNCPYGVLTLLQERKEHLKKV